MLLEIFILVRHVSAAVVSQGLFEGFENANRGPIFYPLYRITDTVGCVQTEDVIFI